MSWTDRVVLRLDLSNEVRDVVVAVKKGNTTLTRTSSIWELGLADISIKKGVISISQSDITDLRFNSAICGRAYNELLTVNTTSIFNQMQAIVSEQESKWQTQTARQEQDWQKQTNKQESDWQSQTNKQEQDWKKLFEEMRVLYIGLETQSFALVNNNFDDWSVRRGCNKTTVFNADGSITEAITVVATSFVMARKSTAFNADGSITETITFHPFETKEGNNEILTTNFEITRRTVFNADGSIKEEIR